MASFPDPSARSGRSQSQGGDPLTAAKHAQRAGTGALAMATLQDQLAATMRRERGGGKAAAAGEKGGATAATSSTTAGAYELSSTAARGQRGTSFSIPGTASWIAPPSGELAQSGSGAGGGDQSSAFRASTAGSSDSVGRSTSFDRRTIGSSSMVGGGGTGHGSGNSGAGGGGKVGGGVAVAAGDGGGGEGAATGQQLQGGEGGGTTLPRVRSPTLDGRKVGGGERERGGREGSVGGSGGAAVLTTTSSARSLSSQGTADHGGTDAMSDIIDRLLYHASSIGDEAGSEGGADVAAGSESGTVEDEAAAEPFDPFCINVWSGPRSMSTCLMYSFLQRDDVCALDEPLYAHFLRHTGVWRPYRDRLLAEMDSNGDRVVQDVILSPRKKKILFVKQMGKHIAGLSHQSRESLLMGTRHVILIRNPIASLPSFEKVVPVTLAESSLPELCHLYSELRCRGRPPVVVDVDLIPKDPEGALRTLCTALDIPFQSSMISWKPGPKPEDGLWAAWWYSSVHKSSGFFAQSTSYVAFPKNLYPLLEECMPFYLMLKRHAIQPETAESNGVASDGPSVLLSSRSQLSQSPRLLVPKNEQLLVWVDGQLLPREDARVSVFDSTVQGGDAVWEGVRVYNGKIFKLDEHLDRLEDSAKAMAFSDIPDRVEIKKAIFSTLAANGMRDGVHVRLTLSRGKKVTSGMSPAFNQYGPTLIVLAEWKLPVYDNAKGIKLTTASTRRNPPQCVDSKIHHANLINNILAKIEGNSAGTADAIMLDVDGFVAETNATNLFMIKRGRVLTPAADYCTPGITRGTIMQLAMSTGLLIRERRLSLAEFYSADEVFATGTMGEITPVIEIDGRVIHDGKVGKFTQQLRAAFKKLTETEGTALPF